MISNPESLQPEQRDQDLRMSGFVTRFASVVCLLVILTGPSSALFWQPTVPTYPLDPKDDLYKAFETVPSPSDTADKLLANFLHIGQNVNKRSLRIQDNVFVMDGSGSIGSCNFEKGKKALKYMMGLDDPTKVSGRYAAVTFSNSATVNFKFLPYSLAVSEIMKISYPGGGTNTQYGLAEAKKLFEDPFSGGRAISRKTVFLVTDGQSNYPSLTVASAKELKRAGLVIQVLAVGGYISGIDEMVKVASTKDSGPPTPKNVLLYRVKDYNGFWKVVELMLEKVDPSTWKVVKGQYDPPCPVWG